MIFANGTVEWSHPAVYTVTCEIDIKDFPLDEQKCALEIASWAYSEDKIKLHAHIEHSLQHYAPNEEWHLLNVSVVERRYEHEGILVSEIHYEIYIKRKPLFYIVTVTFPSYVMCSISIVGLFVRFSTKPDRQERFSLGVTAILTCAVLSLVVSEKVPHSSTSVPLLLAYFLFNMIVISLACLMTGVVMWIHHKGRFGAEPPKWLMRVFLFDCLIFKKINNHEQHKNHQLNKAIFKKSKNTKRCESVVSIKNNLITTEQDDIRPLKKNNSYDESFNQRLLAIDTFLNSMEKIFPNPTKSCHNISTANSFKIRNHKSVKNGYVQIGERMDIILMIFCVSLLTFPVLYLFVSI